MTEPIATSQQSRIGGSRAAVLTMADQVVSSASNFVVGVLVARAGGASALGSFGIALLVWLTVLGAHRAVITDPMTVVGSTDKRYARLREGMLASAGLGSLVAGVLAAVAGVLLFAGVDAVAIAALAPWLPSLLMQDYWRAMAFRLQRADHALINDVVFAAVQGLVTVALFALDIKNVAAFIASWGAGATAGAVIGLHLARIRIYSRGGFAHLRHLWPRSRWFLAEFSTTFTGFQGYQLMLPMLLGKDEFGSYRAGASLVGPALLIFIAAGNVGVPEGVRQLRRHGIPGLRSYTPRVTFAVLALIVTYGAAVALLAGPLLQRIYGQQFTAGTIVTQLMAAQYLLIALGLGCDIALKAAGQMKQLWRTRAVSAIISIVCVIVLPTWFGITGAGLVGILSGLAYAVGVALAYRQLCRRGILDEVGDGRHYAKPEAAVSATRNAPEADQPADVASEMASSSQLSPSNRQQFPEHCDTNLPPEVRMKY